MAPPKNGRRRRGAARQETSGILASVNRLVEAVTGLVGSVGHAAASASVALRGAKAPGLAKVPATIARKSERLRKSIRAHWAKMTPEQREARIRKMLAGRGLQRKAPAGKTGAGRGRRRGKRGPGRPKGS
jgi:hypothetical protein